MGFLPLASGLSPDKGNEGQHLLLRSLHALGQWLRSFWQFTECRRGFANFYCCILRSPGMRAINELPNAGVDQNNTLLLKVFPDV